MTTTAAKELEFRAFAMTYSTTFGTRATPAEGTWVAHALVRRAGLDSARARVAARAVGAPIPPESLAPIPPERRRRRWFAGWSHSNQAPAELANRQALALNAALVTAVPSPRYWG